MAFIWVSGSLLLVSLITVFSLRIPGGSTLEISVSGKIETILVGLFHPLL